MMPVKFLIVQFLAGLVHDDGAQEVEQLAGVEAVALLAADGGDGIVEIVEHDVLLRHALALAPGRRALRTALATASQISVEERFEVRLLAVADVIGI